MAVIWMSTAARMGVKEAQFKLALWLGEFGSFVIGFGIGGAEINGVSIRTVRNDGHQRSRKFKLRDESRYWMEEAARTFFAEYQWAKSSESSKLYMPGPIMKICDENGNMTKEAEKWLNNLRGSYFKLTQQDLLRVIGR